MLSETSHGKTNTAVESEKAEHVEPTMELCLLGDEG